MAAKEEVLVDPAVSRAKFDLEIAKYRELEDYHLRRGVWLVRAKYPEMFVVFGAPKLKPPAVIFGALLDFSNYDLWPPSVKLVDPFTRVPYKHGELPYHLLRQPSTPSSPAPPGQVQMVMQQPDDLMQAHSLDEIPFLCIQGVREYHEHPAHTGDPWLLHRDGGKGTLHLLLERIYKYGVEPLVGYNVTMQPMIAGFAPGYVPE